jgi:hypothetical protein
MNKIINNINNINKIKTYLIENKSALINYSIFETDDIQLMRSVLSEDIKNLKLQYLNDDDPDNIIFKHKFDKFIENYNLFETEIHDNIKNKEINILGSSVTVIAVLSGICFHSPLLISSSFIFPAYITYKAYNVYYGDNYNKILIDPDSLNNINKVPVYYNNMIKILNDLTQIE